jgi:hypothetical protein
VSGIIAKRIAQRVKSGFAVLDERLALRALRLRSGSLSLEDKTKGLSTEG